MRAAVETPFTFFPVERKRFFAKPIEPSHMPVGLVPEIFNAIHVVAVLNKRRGMIQAHVMKPRDIQGIITGQRIGIDHAVGHDPLVANGQQRRRLRIGHGRSIETFPPRFRMLKTGTLPAAPRPRLLFRRPPKYLSSTSTAPDKGLALVNSSTITRRKRW